MRGLSKGAGPKDPSGAGSKALLSPRDAPAVALLQESARTSWRRAKCFELDSM
jgi:hypothetical protein